MPAVALFLPPLQLPLPCPRSTTTPSPCSLSVTRYAAAAAFHTAPRGGKIDFPCDMLSFLGPPPLCLFLLLLSSASLFGHGESLHNYHLDLKEPDNALSLEEAIARGNAVRTVVIEATEEERDLSPSFDRLLGVDDESLAYGHKVGGTSRSSTRIAELEFTGERDFVCRGTMRWLGPSGSENADRHPLLSSSICARPFIARFPSTKSCSSSCATKNTAAITSAPNAFSTCWS